MNITRTKHPKIRWISYLVICLLGLRCEVWGTSLPTLLCSLKFEPNFWLFVFISSDLHIWEHFVRLSQSEYLIKCFMYVILPMKDVLKCSNINLIFRSYSVFGIKVELQMLVILVKWLLRFKGHLIGPPLCQIKQGLYIQ